MTDTQWTWPGAYIAEDPADFDGVLIDHAARRMRRVFDHVASQLDRAHAETACLRARKRIADSMDAITTAIATDDVLRSVLASPGPVRISDTLHDLCSLASGSPIAKGALIELMLAGDAELSWAEPDTAWVIAAAAVEMLEEIAEGEELRLKVELRVGRLLITAVSVNAPPATSRRRAAQGTFLERLAALLDATVERRRVGRRVSVRMAISTRRSTNPDADPS